MKIGYKLTVIMIVLSLFSAGAVGITLLIQVRNNIASLSHDKAVASAQDYAGEIRSFFASYWFTAETIASVLEDYENIPENSRRSFINAALESELNRHDGIVAVWNIWEPDVLEGNDIRYIGTPGTTDNGRFAPCWYRDEGEILMYALDEDEFEYSKEGEYYQLPRDKGYTMLLPPYLDDIGGKQVMNTTIAVPIYSRDRNKVLGVVGLDLGVGIIQSMSQEHMPFGNGVSAVFSNDGTVVAHFDSARIGEPLKETEQDMAGPYLNDMLASVNYGELFYFTNYISELKAEYNIVITPIAIGESGSPWSYAIAVPTKTVMAAVNRMVLTVIIISIAVLSLVIIGAVILSRSLSKPIVMVTAALRDISEGEGDLTKQLAVASKDEIGDLALYFNKTLGNIRNLIGVIKYKVNALTNTGHELSVNMDTTSSAVDEIAENFEEIKGLEAKQQIASNEVDKSLEDIKTSIDLLNKLIGDQTESVNTSSSAIEEMTANIHSVTQTLIANGKNVDTLTEASEHGRTALQAVAQEIQGIAKDSEGLLEINSVMNSIAAQTNLLSMNAAIEAAHAGASGRGFAVVADEIRKLAESSSKQSKTTAVMLKKIKASIDNITKSSNEVLSRFGAIDTGVKTVSEHELNIRNAMEEQEIGGQQILHAIGRLKEITSSVQKGSEDMYKSGDDLIRETDEFKTISNDAVNGMSGIVNGALKEIKIAVTHVTEMSTENNRNFEELKSETVKFKVSSGNEKKRVLVVDDDEIHLEMTKAFLEHEYDVTTVKSCEDALKLLYQGYDPNFISLDLVMPETDGWHTFERIRGLSKLHQVPIAILTASDDPNDRHRAKAMGAADYIKKPTTQEELLKRIENILSGKT
jgi:methyl-accepting chemotaxis protein